MDSECWQSNGHCVKDPKSRRKYKQVELIQLHRFYAFAV
ncbi:hypothetical protein lhe_0022 [Lactobacillus helveticus CNRZ32]|nr:hypothetical protein lhe_0022 [Lactobacillus helveticus CNRZ32]